MTVICLCKDKQCIFFEGKVYGKISNEKCGIGGFGYDPVFIPEGYENSFAELSPEIKSKISHRAKAVTKMIEYIEENA
jgi:XTP/dITP diphosphohydrolase